MTPPAPPALPLGLPPGFLQSSLLPFGSAGVVGVGSAPGLQPYTGAPPSMLPPPPPPYGMMAPGMPPPYVGGQGGGMVGGGPSGGGASAPSPTNILRLGNMVTAADVADDAEFSDLFADVMDELKKYGAITSLLIPRRGRYVGLIFVEFQLITSAVAAAGPLAAKTFAGKKVLVTYETTHSLADARASDK